MAFRWVLRSTFVTGPWRPLHPNGNFHSVKTLRSFRISAVRKGSCGYYGTVLSARDIHFWKRTQKLNCSHNERPSSSTSEEDELDQGPPQEAVLKAITEVSKTEGRVRRTTNVVIGGTVANDSTNEWLALDQKVNSYPTVRGFTAIGTGGDDFVQAMVVAVESVIQQPIPEYLWWNQTDSYTEPSSFRLGEGISRKKKLQGRVRQRLSSRGKYVSVNIGPVCVVSREQVQAVYDAMRRDNRIKYFL